MLRGRKAALTRGYGCESVDERHCSQCFLRCSRYRDLRSAVRTSSSVRRYVGGSASRMRCPLRGRRTCTIASERCCSFDIKASTVESQPRMSATACSDGPSRGARAEARYSLPHSSCPEAIASVTNLWRYLVRTQVCRARSRAPRGASCLPSCPGPRARPLRAPCHVAGTALPVDQSWRFARLWVFAALSAEPMRDRVATPAIASANIPTGVGRTRVLAARQA